MVLRYSKTPADESVDAHFKADDPRVVVKPSEFPKPLHPEDDGYWAQFSTTVDAVCAAKDAARMRHGVSPAIEKAGVTNAAKAAELVHADWPTDIALLGAKFVTSPFRDIAGLNGVFTDKVVLLNHLMAWAAWQVSASSFCAKRHFLAARPEEVAGAIARDEIDAPESIKIRLFDAIPRAALSENQRSFTMFSEGSPTHGSYNAMHAAAGSAAATVIRVLLGLSEDDIRTINLTAYNTAHFRTSAGVHNPQDNDCGLWLGQEVVARTLPDKLKEMGVRTGAIEYVLKDTRVDWLES